MTIGQQSIIGQCIAVLRQGISLIENLDDETYSRCDFPSKASVGVHFRHNFDFVKNLLCGLKTGKIDYNQRERNLQIETNRHFAISQFETVIESLKNLSAEQLEQKISVCSEIIEEVWCESSTLRELEFLQSHTIHHYALIQSKLEFYGFKVPENFGVAPSTLEFWKEKAASESGN